MPGLTVKADYVRVEISQHLFAPTALHHNCRAADETPGVCGARPVALRLETLRFRIFKADAPSQSWAAGLIDDYFETAEEVDWEPRYNIAPSQNVPVVRQDQTKPERHFSLARWGSESPAMAFHYHRASRK